MKFTFLDIEQIKQKKLSVFVKEGTYAAEITDFALFLAYTSGAYNFKEYSYSIFNEYFPDHHYKDKLYLGDYYLKPHLKYDFYNNNKDFLKYYINHYYIMGGYSFFIETEYDRLKSMGSRPVLLKYSKIQNDCISKATNSNCVLEVKYGEYPQKKVNDSLKETLIYLENNNKLIKTNKNYTIYSRYYNEYIKCTEYILNGVKYIKLPTDKFIIKDTLDDNNIYKSYLDESNQTWFEVLPIVWLVDKENDIAISKKILFAGISGFQIEKPVKINLRFENSKVYKFMNTHFAKDIIPSNVDLIEKDSYIDEKEINYSKIQKNNSEIEILLYKINYYLENVKNKDNVINNINTLIEEYNKKLDLIKDNLYDNKFNFMLEDENILKNNLIISLNIILDKLKSYYESNHIYYDILNKINSLINMINDNLTIDSNDNLITDFNTINSCISILKDEDKTDIKNQILYILINEENRILEYLKIQENFDNKIILKDNKLNYSTYLEFELLLREYINPILIYLNNKITKRDIELEISNSIKEIINNIYDNTKDRTLCFYLNLISNIKSNIDNLLKTVDNKKYDIFYSKLLEILNIEIDYDKDLTEILKNINSIIISLNKLTFDIENYSNKTKIINNSYVKLLVKT